MRYVQVWFACDHVGCRCMTEQLMPFGTVPTTSGDRFAVPSDLPDGWGRLPRGADEALKPSQVAYHHSISNQIFCPEHAWLPPAAMLHPLALAGATMQVVSGVQSSGSLGVYSSNGITFGTLGTQVAASNGGTIVTGLPFR